jgi:hypothetical protein
MTAADGQIERQATGDSWALPPAPPATKTLRRLLRDAKPYLLIIALVVASASVFSAGRMTRAWLFTAGSLAAFGLIMATTYKPVKTLARPGLYRDLVRLQRRET